MDDLNLTWHQVDSNAARLIGFASRRLAGRYGFSCDEAPDIAQELALDYLKRRTRHDASRCSLSTFLRMVVAHRTASLVEYQRADCRDYRRRTDFDALAQGRRPGAPLKVNSSCRNHREERLNLRLDVRRVIARLPHSLKRICLLILSSEAPGDIPDSAGISRATFYRAVGQIRDAFAEAGIYLYGGL